MMNSEMLKGTGWVQLLERKKNPSSLVVRSGQSLDCGGIKMCRRIITALLLYVYEQNFSWCLFIKYLLGIRLCTLLYIIWTYAVWGGARGVIDVRSWGVAMVILIYGRVQRFKDAAHAKKCSYANFHKYSKIIPQAICF